MTGLKFPFETPPDPHESIEVAKGIHWLRLGLPMVLDHVNCYAIDEGDSWTLIDTGMDTPQSRAQWQQLLAGPLGAKPVRRVIGTHHHADHIGLAGWFMESGAELLMTRTAWLTARMLCLDEQHVPTPQAMAYYTLAGMPAAMRKTREQQRPMNFCDRVAPLPVGFTRLAEGDLLEMGGRRWHVRLGSGHAPDHATFWSDDGIILGGDQLLPGISPNISVHPTEIGADPLQDWLESCRNFLPSADAAQLVLPGHKLPFYGLPLRLQQMIDGHEKALVRLEAHLAQPRKAVECFSVLFRRELTDGLYTMGLAEALAHLNYLLFRGRCSRSLGPDGAWLWHSPKSDAQANAHNGAEMTQPCSNDVAARPDLRAEG